MNEQAQLAAHRRHDRIFGEGLLAAPEQLDKIRQRAAHVEMLVQNLYRPPKEPGPLTQAALDVPVLLRELDRIRLALVEE